MKPSEMSQQLKNKLSNRVEIRKQLGILEHERRLKLQELMKEYDREYYYPKRKELEEACGDHDYIYSHDNGFFHEFYRCTVCGKVDSRQFRSSEDVFGENDD